jgi:hypothetical protein
MTKKSETSKSSIEAKIKLVKQPQLSPTELLLQQALASIEELKTSQKALQEELATKQTVRPKPNKPTLIVEEFASKTRTELLLLLAEEIIKAWVYQGFSGVQSRQQNIYNLMTTSQVQELLKVILDKSK